MEEAKKIINQSIAELNKKIEKTKKKLQSEDLLPENGIVLYNELSRYKHAVFELYVVLGGLG